LHQRNRGITFLDHVISFIIDKKSGFNGLGIFYALTNVVDQISGSDSS